jgi:hypothetical protein
MADETPNTEKDPKGVKNDHVIVMGLRQGKKTLSREEYVKYVAARNKKKK